MIFRIAAGSAEGDYEGEGEGDYEGDYEGEGEYSLEQMGRSDGAGREQVAAIRRAPA